MTIIQHSCFSPNEPDLLPLNEAIALILKESTAINGHEYIPISQAKGRILAEDIIAPFNVPRCTNAAVDGFALRSLDLPLHNTRRFTIVGRALAGKPFTGECKAGACVAITTGAVMPDGLDSVIMQEQVTQFSDSIEIDSSHRSNQNVRQAGEDIAEKSCILANGKMLTPPDIGLLASIGIGEVRVKRKLRVAIASTGDEIFNIGTLPGTVGNYDSNQYCLSAALSRPDIDVINLGILADQPDLLLTRFKDISTSVDLIISSGGVSVGAADYTKTALSKCGQLHFWKVAIKPGRPIAFGKIGSASFFGLPGNPVAVMVTFYLLVIPALEKMLGVSNKLIAPRFKAIASEAFNKKPGRTEIIRGILSQNEHHDWQVKSTGQQGSGILRSMSLANAFIILPHSSTSVKPGDWVLVQPFSGLF